MTLLTNSKISFMMKTIREGYLTPEVEVYEVMVEQGIAQTNTEDPEPGWEL